MSRRRKKSLRKRISQLLIILLITSLILPQYAGAEESSTPEIGLEEAKKQEFKKEATETEQLEWESKQNEAFTSENVMSLMDGLNLTEEPSHEEDAFVMDGKVETKVVQQLDETETVNVIIRLKEQVEMKELVDTVSELKSKNDRGESVVNQLQSVANETQTNVMQQLEGLQDAGKVSNLKQFWIFNGIAATVNKEALELIAERKDIERITLDVEIQAPEFKVEETKPRLPEWGLEKINATDVWGEYGLQGEGIVVGIMDSGVQGDHEALHGNYRGRDGNHVNSWIDLSGHGYETPTDGNGHGTHVAGTILGGGDGEPIGVAPGAEWIAAKIFNDSGGTTASAIHEAFQWFMAPGGDPTKAPDVVNNSWGSADTYRTEFLEDVRAWVAVGIFPLFAAGNDGPGSGTIGSPASFPESFAIGATDRYDQIASFSSRGPVYWTNENGEQDYHIKPEVSAPGAEIYSALPNGGYGLASGTSMATPHVAGTIALIMQSNPELTSAEIMTLLEDTARKEAHMGELPNDDYGHGIVDVYQAVTVAAYAGEITGTLTDGEGNPIAGTISVPDENLTLSVGEDGAFSFKLREGVHEIEISSFGFHSKTESVEIVKDETYEYNWTLETAERFDVTGTITFENDDPAAYAYVRVKDTPLETFRTNEAGEFVIPSIPESEYTIVVSGNGVKQKTETITVNRDVQLNLKVEAISIEAEEDWATSKNNFARNAVTAAEVDAENMVKNWSYETPGQVVFSSPVIAEGKVVFTTDRGYVVALNQQTGEEVWTIGTGSSNRSTPTVVDGVVYVAGGNDSSIHAIELNTGVKKWSTQLEFPAVYESPIYQNGKVYISSYMDDNALTVALDAETGKILWETEIGNGAYFGAALGTDSLFVGTYDTKTLASLDLADGSKKWEVTFESEGVAANPVFKDGVLYVATTNFSTGAGTLRAIDPSSGEEQWRADGIGNTEAGSPIVFDNLVIVSSAVNPVIKAFNKENGELVWETENGSTIVNTGSVSGNGQLFVTDLASKLNVYDVYSGEKLYTYNLSNVSTGGVALTDGQVVTADYTEVSSFHSPGTVSGTIVDTEGNPLESTITIVGTDESVETDSNGNYTLQARPGNYTLKVMSYGYKQEVESITVVSGYEITKDFELEVAEIGSLTGQIVDAQTNKGLENVTISVENTSLETTTDASGNFSFSEIYEGTYNVTIATPGYVATTISVTIKPEEETKLTHGLSKVQVAVLQDMEGQIVRFLNNNGISAEEHGWDIIDNINSFEIVYLNGSYTSEGPKPTEEQINGIIAAAKEHNVSLVFADTWGPSYGSIKYLSEYTGDPAQEDSETSYSGNVVLKVEAEHPIFEGIEKGVTYTTLTNGYAAWFNQYSGRNLASVGMSGDGLMGSGVSYKAVTENSAHLLLSTHAASPWVSPFDGWTSIQQQIFLNGMNYLLEDAEYGKLSGTVKDAEGNPVEGVTVQAIDTGVTVTTDSDGNYELFHDVGSFDVQFTKTGYSKQKKTVEFINGQPVEENITMTSSTSGTISGQITNKITGQQVPYVEIELYDQEGNLVTEEVTTASGTYEITGLNEATYTLKIVFRDYVTYTEDVEVGAEPVSLNIELYPEPRVATIKDYSFGSIREVLADVGIEAVDYSLSDVMEELPNLDVVFFNDASTSKEDLEAFIAAADEHEVSIIYGDTYWSGSGINQLVTNLKDPESRSTHRDTNSSAGYMIHEENPIFGNAKVGDFVEILIPSASSVGSFEGYSGYTLADITHGGNEETHGTGVAYKPRTAGSMELLMSGHGTSFTHDTRDYTEQGNEMFVNAILWAAYIDYNVVEGYITDQEGNPLVAEVKITGDIEQTAQTDPETGYFNLGALDGEYELEVNSFGYQTYTQSVTLNENFEALNIEMLVDESVGSIEGRFVDENTLEGIQDAQITIVGHPREATTGVSGEFVIDRLLPDTYTLVVEKDGYVQQEFEIEVQTGEAATFEKTMKPSPTVGVVVDADGSRYVNVTDYLTSKGYIVEDLSFTDLDRIGEMDLVFVNSDYGNEFIPEKEEFLAFTKELDRTETPIIWTGNGGPRGGIRFLVDYLGDPKVENAGTNSSSSRTMTATLVEEHPVLEGVEFDDNGQFSFDGNYYYGFEGYTGTTLANISHPTQGELGSFIAVGGRTTNSVEVLLSTMTFGYGFTDKYFDENREKVVNNAILWALDNEEALVGEVHGTVTNNLGNSVFATLTVEETGYSINTEQDGTFFLGLEDGTYNITFDAFGHSSESFEVTVENGQVLEKTFTLTADNSGTVTGQVKAIDTGEGIEGATIQFVGTPLQTTTDAKGNYEIAAPAGSYQLRVIANGFSPQVVDVNVVHNEEMTVNFDLTISQKIAFVASAYNANRAIPFLSEQGYEAVHWDYRDLGELMEQLGEYALVIFNDSSSSVTEEQFKAFVDETDRLGISVIFPSQWGNGTIDELTDYYNDPEEEFDDFEDMSINYTVTQEHPIFAGYEVGDVIKILDRGEYSQQYHAFESYSGTTLADVTHDTVGRLGSGLAFDFRTANSVHVLLGSLHIGGYGSPDERWSDETKQIYINAIDWAINASLGEVSGVVTDTEGDPVAGATVSIEEQALTTQTNSNGEYALGVGVGEHDVRVQARGYVSKTETAVVNELGTVVELNFELEATNRMSVSGQIKDVDGDPIQGAAITLTEVDGNVEFEEVSNKDGFYQFDELLAGEYEIQVAANGYQTVQDTLSILDGESIEQDYTLSEFNIAVLGDRKESIAGFFAENDFAAQSRDWDIVNDVYNYRVIVVNSNEGTEEQVNQLIEKADEYETSLIFVDSWGVDGSISLLEEVLGNPTRATQGYDEGAVFVKPAGEHEIFAGFNEEVIEVLSEQSPYATFENYDGITLANLVVDGEDKGATIAYDFRGQNHMHLLMSSYAVNNMVGPNQGWTEHGQQLFLQAVKWARDGSQELPEIPAWTVDANLITNGDAELTGTAEYRSTVNVLHDGEVIATATPSRDNSFTVTVSDLEEGVYDLTLEATNFAGTVTGKEGVQVVVDKQSPVIEVQEPTDQFVTAKEVVDVVGTVSDEHLEKVYVNGEEVTVEDGTFSSRIVLEQGTHTVTIKATDLAGNESLVERQVTVSLDGPVISEIQPSSDQTVQPGDVVKVSFTSEAEGGNASFSVKLPALLATQSTTDHQMEEVEPGFYQGTWTVPTNVDLQGAVIEVALTDVAGNTTRQEATGKLYVSSEQIDRLAGYSRYDTAIEISRDGWDSADTVVLTRGDDFADALAGVPLAHMLDAPVLLTPSNELWADTLAEIKRLGATNVVILGGELAVSDAVLAELEAANLNTRRIAGGSRFDTAALIASEVSSEGAEKVVVANGLNFPDALSVAAYAAKDGMPILLTKSDVLPEATAKALVDLGATETIVVGGDTVISDKVVAELPTPERVSGHSRYDTNIELAKHFGVNSNHLYVATGKSYADALTGAVLAAKNDSGIVLVHKVVPESVAEYLTENNVLRLTIFGGDVAVSEDVLNSLSQLLP